MPVVIYTDKPIVTDEQILGEKRELPAFKRMSLNKPGCVDPYYLIDIMTRNEIPEDSIAAKD
jgi:hypothetical protein